MNNSTSTPGGGAPGPRSSRSHRFWLVLFSRPVLGTLAALSGILGLAAWRAYSYVQQELAPEVEHTLSRTLNRPVQLGELQSSSFNSLQFGPSQIPAQISPSPTDPNYAAPSRPPAPDSLQVEGITVNFDPWEVLWQRKLTLQVTLQKLQIQLVQTADGQWVHTQLTPQPQTGWLQTELQSIQFREAQIQATPFREKPRQFQQVAGNINLLIATATETLANPNPPTLNYDLQGEVVGGGTVKINGDWTDKTQTARFKLNTEALAAPFLNGIVLPAVDPSYLGKGNSVYHLTDGKIDSQLDVLMPVNSETQVFGTAQVSQVSGSLTGLPKAFGHLRGSIRLQGPVTTLESIQGNYGALPFQTRGSIDWRKGYDLTGQLAPVDVTIAAKTLDVQSPVPIAGRVQIPDLKLTGAIANPKLSGTAFSVGSAKIDQLNFQRVAARFEVTAPQLLLTAIQADPDIGGKIVGRGSYGLLTGGRWLTQLQATNLPSDALAKLYKVNSPMPLGQVSALIQQGGTVDNLVTQVQFVAPQAQYPTRGVAILQGDKIWFENVVTQVGAAVVRAKGIVQGNQWQVTAATRDLPMANLDPSGRGNLSGVFNLAGRLDDFRPEAVQATGQVLLSQGIGDLRQPVQAVLQWQGQQQQIKVLQARAPGIVASGLLSANLDRREITRLNLDVAAQDYNLGDLQALGLTNLPTNVTVQGRADFRGRVTGTPQSPSLTGVVRTRSLQVNQVAFEPGMLGRLSYVPGKGAGLQLQGRRDRIGFNLDRDFQPLAVVVQREQASAVGQRQGDDFVVAVRQFPLQSVPFAGASPVAGVAGLVSGDFRINFPALEGRSNREQVVGRLEINRPRWSGVIADRLTSSVRMAGGVVSFPDGVVQRGQRQYQFQGQLRTGNDPQLTAKLSTADGQIQDLLPILRSFGYSPSSPRQRTYRAAAVAPAPVGNANAPLSEQLELLAAVDKALAQARPQTATPLPLDLSLEQLQGPFRGQVNLVGSQRGVNAQFDLQSKDLSLSDIKLDQTTIQGDFNNGVTQLRTLALVIQGGAVQFSGTLGGKKQQGKLTINNFPLDVMRRLAGFPQLDIMGKLNGRANLSGSLTNPQLEGQFNLQQATLNQQPVTAANARFNYDRGRLQLNSTAQLGNTTEPVQIVGSLPLQLGDRPPSNDRIDLNLSVRNQGLSLINLFTENQLTWISGEGAANLQVGGTLRQPTVNGLISLNQASLKSALFSQPLTGVTGTIRFSRDRLNVEQLTAQYSTGQATAAGVLPINDPLASNDPDRLRPLRLSLNQADARVPDLYNGQINGNLMVTGTVFEPILGGTVQLSNGEILLNQSMMTAGVNSRFNAQLNSQARSFSPTLNLPAVNTASPIGLNLSALANDNATPSSLLMLTSADAGKKGNRSTSMRLNQLQVQLGENVRISSSPLFSFVGQGEVTLNGSLAQIQPQGKVEFKRGQVNLFTSRFRLAPGESNFAEFIPSQGLDPTLNINLITTATEVFGSRANRLDEFETVPFSTLGSLTSVRVQAKVTGRASQLETNFRNNVELTSIPARSEEELLALLGGWSGPAGGRNTPTLALANLAGNALFNRVQGLVNDSLGNRVNFRLFPTLIPVDVERASFNSAGSVLGLGAEVGYDITRRFSVSAMQVLTAPDTPTQFNLGYQLNDRWRFSTSVDVAGQGVGLLEYRIRF